MLELAGTALENGLRREGLLGFSQSLQKAKPSGMVAVWDQLLSRPFPSHPLQRAFANPADHN